MAACGGERSSADTALRAEGTAAAGRLTPAAAEEGRDVASIEVCTLLPGEEIATALDSRQADPAHGMQSEAGSHCWYSLTPQGDQSRIGRQYIVWLLPPSYFMPPESGGEPVAGVLDEAYIRYDAREEQYRLSALRRGDVSMEVIGQDRERTRKLAELAAARL